MKKILLLLLLLINTIAFSQDFEKNWKKVVEYEKDGKVKSASEEVEKIYHLAKKKKNEPEIIKTFFFRSKYLLTLEEDALDKIIENIKNEKKLLSFAGQSILDLIYAECLSKYKTKHQYTINRRTNTDSIFNADFKTWTVEDFEDEITKSYENSIAKRTILEKVPLSNYEILIDFEKLSQIENSSLFDFLVEKYISHLEDKIRYESFGNKEELSKIAFSITPLKRNNTEFKSQKLNKLLSLYSLKESQLNGQSSIFQRVKFLNRTFLNNSSEYHLFLNRFQNSVSDKSLIQEIQLEKGIIFNSKASKNNFPEGNKMAISVLDSILQNEDRSNVYKTAFILKKEILKKTFLAEFQEFTYEKENTRSFVNFKNLDSIRFSFYKIPSDLNFKNRSKKITDSIVEDLKLKQKPDFVINSKLPNKKDYLDTSTEILLPKLELGKYLVYIESDEITYAKEYSSTYKVITSTNLFPISYETNDAHHFEIYDRKTGKPIEKLDIKFDDEKEKTNANGEIFIKKTTSENLKHKLTNMTLARENDTLSFEISRYSYKYNSNEENKESNFGEVNILLDRAIYRPGQTVYGKGIIHYSENGKSSVVPHTSVAIEISDPNYNTVKEFTAITNEFGSFIFEFEIPKNSVTGEFTIEAEEPTDYSDDIVFDKKNDRHPFWDAMLLAHQSTEFSVEEYKRPKFEVTFDPITESYLVNQRITVSGQTKSFTGSTVTDAKVKYKITRKAFRTKTFQDYAAEEFISEGETKTDDKGKFSILFEALPSTALEKEDLPVFNYEITADITDINGETRSNKTKIKVGYHALTLSARIPSVIQTDKKNKLLLNSQNLNGEFVNCEGEILIYFISENKNLFKHRKFFNPDVELISDTDFKKLFPYENNEDTKTTTAPTLVYSQRVDTKNNKEIDLDFLSKFNLGQYKLVFKANDKFDNLIETESLFSILKPNSVVGNSIIKFEQLNNDPKKDGFAEIKIISKIPELFIKVVGYQKVPYNQIIKLKDGVAVLKFPIAKNQIEDFSISLSTVFENQNFNYSMPVLIKKPKEKLEFETISFRNKLEPGSSEIWSFKIKQLNKKAEAEILASMYDASLDQFTEAYWNQFSEKPNYENFVYKKEMAISQISLHLNERYELPQFNFEKKNRDLIWFGFDFNTNRMHINENYYKNITKTKIPKNAKIIYGIVTESTGLPLPGVTISVSGTSRTTQSDFDGYYEIEAINTENLEFEFIGMITKTVAISSNELNVSLMDDIMTMDGVVIEAFRSTTRKKSMVASTSVTSKTIEGRPNASFLETLLAQVPGLEITTGTGQPGSNSSIILRGFGSINGNNKPLYVIDGVPLSDKSFQELDVNSILDLTILKDASATSIYGSRGANGVIVITTKKAIEELSKVQTRKNFNETAFFFPQIKTDKNGNFSFNFTSPEALTQWKLRIFAHNKKAVSGYLESLVVTQKDLMVMPNLPRFLREKDSITITSKISNLTSEEKSGMALLQLFDAVSMEPIDAKMLNSNNTKSFQVDAKGNTSVSWKIYVPEGLQGVQYKIVAKAGNFSDGEENILPVLTNSMLVTESIPIWVRENSTKEYTFENLKNNTSTTLRNQQLTLEYTSNPTWLAIQSLPYLMEYEHECAEQTFARYYANVLASEILNSNPKIAAVFESWKKSDKPISKLQQNEELKSILLAETPWVAEAQSEEEKKKNLATLFDLQKMKDSQKTILEKLIQKQNASGGFAWFEGGEENEYVTRHIISGLGHLQKLSKNATGDFDKITKKGVSYLDQKFLENHKSTEALNKSQKLLWNYPYNNLHYLYARSFYLEKYPLSESTLLIMKKYTENIKENWLPYSLYEKGLASLVLSHFGEKETAKKILESLRQTSSNNEDWGMYWIENKAGWYWYQAPIETQALLIEAFAEIENDKKSVDAMKVWLLKNKQNKNWPTTKATTEAVYALLMQGTDWISVKDKTIIKLGNEKIITKKLAENEKEAGTGYIKMTWKTDEILKEMATVSINNKSEVPGFGGFYWQYLEDLDKIKTSQESVMKVEKGLYLRATTSNGDQLQRITSTKPLKIGDLVTVRLVITSKEDMEFVHLKDMRASCFEPIDVLSGNNYKDGLRFYKSTKDVATHFFFDQIKKGTYVLEYDMRVNNLGDFSNGITTIQSMYAPEFSSHTKGIRVKIAE